MRKITCGTTFLEDRERFEAGEKLCTTPGHGCRVITDEQAERFVSNGWASSADTESPPDVSGDVSLSIANGTHGQEARHG